MPKQSDKPLNLIALQSEIRAKLFANTPLIIGDPQPDDEIWAYSATRISTGEKVDPEAVFWNDPDIKIEKHVIKLPPEPHA